MKIALLGYGKLGKAIEKIALLRGHEIVLKKNSSCSFEGLLKADVAIDFSLPNVALENISECLKSNIPVVSGTTGWLHNFNKAVALTQETKGAFLYGSNFSLGVNLFFELNQKLAKLMASYNEYKVSMQETHHTQKLDAPSGTALTLANQIIENSNYSNWEIATEQTDASVLPIEVHRIENVAGWHQVKYTSSVDSIEISHQAFSREGFALGAVIAAEWIIGKKGIFSMKDVLDLEK